MEVKEFKVGQKWRMRGGEIATITDPISGGSGRKVVTRFAGRKSSFTADGCHWPDNSESQFDLMTLVEDVAPEPAEYSPAPLLEIDPTSTEGGKSVVVPRPTAVGAVDHEAELEHLQGAYRALDDEKSALMLERDRLTAKVAELSRPAASGAVDLSELCAIQQHLNKIANRTPRSNLSTANPFGTRKYTILDAVDDAKACQRAVQRILAAQDRPTANGAVDHIPAAPTAQQAPVVQAPQRDREWSKHVTDAYLTLRKHNCSIPDDALDAMRAELLAPVVQAGVPEGLVRASLDAVVSAIESNDALNVTQMRKIYATELKSLRAALDATPPAQMQPVAEPVESIDTPEFISLLHKWDAAKPGSEARAACLAIFAHIDAKLAAARQAPTA